MDNKEANNIVLFPRAKRDSHPQTLKEVQQAVEGVKKQVAEIIIDESIGTIFKGLTNYKVVVKEKDGNAFMKDISLIVEAIRAAVYRSLEFSHPLHTISSDMFDVANNGSEVSFNTHFMEKYLTDKDDEGKDGNANTAIKV
jgi:hypothetical protein